MTICALRTSAMSMRPQMFPFFSLCNVPFSKSIFCPRNCVTGNLVRLRGLKSETIKYLLIHKCTFYEDLVIYVTMEAKSLNC
ncbi:hypothetical protein L596_022327 [Steinernema carpocapsae]|uniref:Uncharacterized protein n=1 Tax=Steinernema carpocapsae TaxID=34508 RepID=A0A4U5MM88_STECR|nr:hypothetical protein L596_022327 [Steinernema carpocapsae]